MPCKSTVYSLFAEFPHSCVNLSDEFRDGRPSNAVNNENVVAVSRMIEIDGHVTYYEIRVSIGRGMSQIQSILQKCEKFVFPMGPSQFN